MHGNTLKKISITWHAFQHFFRKKTQQFGQNCSKNSTYFHDIFYVSWEIARFLNLGLMIIKMIVFEHNIQMELLLKIFSEKSYNLEFIFN